MNAFTNGEVQKAYLYDFKINIDELEFNWSPSYINYNKDGVEISAIEFEGGKVYQDICSISDLLKSYGSKGSVTINLYKKNGDVSFSVCREFTSMTYETGLTYDYNQDTHSGIALVALADTEDDRNSALCWNIKFLV